MATCMGGGEGVVLSLLNGDFITELPCLLGVVKGEGRVLEDAGEG